MKRFDRVQLVTDKYEDKGVLNGSEGTIVEIWLRKGIPTGYEVAFTNLKTGEDYARFAVQKDDVIKIE